MSSRSPSRRGTRRPHAALRPRRARAPVPDHAGQSGTAPVESSSSRTNRGTLYRGPDRARDSARSERQRGLASHEVGESVRAVVVSAHRRPPFPEGGHPSGFADNDPAPVGLIVEDPPLVAGAGAAGVVEAQEQVAQAHDSLAIALLPAATPPEPASAMDRPRRRASRRGPARRRHRWMPGPVAAPTGDHRERWPVAGSPAPIGRAHAARLPSTRADDHDDGIAVRHGPPVG